MRMPRRHPWLFTFVDTAFILLLVFTQFARLNTANTPVAEMRLPAPVVDDHSELKPVKASPDYRQVLVEKHSVRPFRLAHIIGGNEKSRSAALSLEELDASLQEISGKRQGEPRPVVVPLPESFSSDLLQAAALVGKRWNAQGNAVVHLKTAGNTRE